jgi:hypothetical protein
MCPWNKQAVHENQGHIECCSKKSELCVSVEPCCSLPKRFKHARFLNGLFKNREDRNAELALKLAWKLQRCKLTTGKYTAIDWKTALLGPIVFLNYSQCPRSS